MLIAIAIAEGIQGLGGSDPVFKLHQIPFQPQLTTKLHLHQFSMDLS